MSSKRPVRIVSQAPTRADLAGGTVDIWPLYLFLKQPRTLNLGIDLFAETTLEVEEGDGEGGVTLRSGDQGSELKLGWDQVLGDASAPPYVELHLKLLRFFARERQAGGQLDTRQRLTLSTVAKSPAGAGLGGSSTLSISMIGAIGTWARGHIEHGSGGGADGRSMLMTPIDPERDGDRFIEIVRDTETTVIQVPAGMQDYYGAMFGGLQSLNWGAGTHQRRRPGGPTAPAELEKRLLLFYSGQSRNSGINNWALFKMFIDKQERVRERFQEIVDATHALEGAIEKSDWAAASKAIAAEWDVRRTLAQGISTPEMDQAFALARKEDPSSSGKVCGAGGGGCFFVFVPSGDPALMGRIRDGIAALGIRPLPFKAVPRGLEVRVSHG